MTVYIYDTYRADIYAPYMSNVIYVTYIVHICIYAACMWHICNTYASYMLHIKNTYIGHIWTYMGIYVSAIGSVV